MKKPLLFLLTTLLFNPLFADEPLLSTQTYNYGEYCVTSDNLELIPLDFDETIILFSIFKNGTLYQDVTFSQIIKNKKNLESTVSHYKWGTIIGINTNGILLNTVEGKKIFDFETQKVRQLNINNDIYIVEDELKILTKQKGYEYLNALFDYMFALDEQECNEILNKWEKYKVQIASFNKNGKEYIYFNFLGGGILTKKFLESGLIQVCDGGNAFWSICYNLKEKKFYNLSINGET